ncbi:MAG: NAD-binding protein [Verrucomicrobia bacterium]|nr:NAD-binding protein [Verrucomicrobiota bacterium]
MNLLTVATIFTTLATPFLTSQKLTDFLLHALSRFDIQAKKLDSNLHNHALVLGFGDGGPHLLKPIQESGYPVLVIEDDGQVVDQLRKMKIPCIFGDAGDPNLLKRAGIDRAAFVLVSMRRFEDIREVLRYASQVQIYVRVFEESEARQVLELGGIPVSSADASVQSLELWISKIFLNGKARA